MSDEHIVVSGDNQTVVVTSDGATLIVDSRPTYVVVESEEEAPAPEEVPAPEISYIQTEEQSTIVVGESGAQGPPGPAGASGAPGDPGPEGPPGVAGGFYRHVQGVPSDTWEIVHNLNFYPGGIKVKDSGGMIIDAMRTTYPDSNTVILKFFVGMQPVPFSGEAYLS